MVCFSVILLSEHLHLCFVSFVSLSEQSYLLRPEVSAGCLGFFFFLVTLYSWTTPFCSSSGGGCQETMMAVPLSPLSVTVTLRGGALGAGEVDKRKKMFIYDRGGKKPKCLQSLPAFSVQFSCQNFFCA